MFLSILFPVWFQGRAGQERLHKSFGKRKGSSSHAVLKVCARRVPSFTPTQWTGSPSHSSWVLSASISHYTSFSFSKSWVYSSAVKDASSVHSCNFEVNERQTGGLPVCFHGFQLVLAWTNPIFMPTVRFLSWVFTLKLHIGLAQTANKLHSMEPFPDPSPFNTQWCYPPIKLL